MKTAIMHGQTSVLSRCQNGRSPSAARAAMCLDPADVWYESRALPGCYANARGQIKDAHGPLSTHLQGRNTRYEVVSDRDETCFVYELVYLAFHPGVAYPLRAGITIKHVDGNTLNNQPHNLQLADSRLRSLNQTRRDTRHATGLQARLKACSPRQACPARAAV
jgi:hypothetical protein